MSSKELSNIERDQAEPHPSSAITPRRLRWVANKACRLFMGEFDIAGTENLEDIRRFRHDHPEQKFIITASHLSNFDAPAAIDVFGNDFNLQIVVASDHFRDPLKSIAYGLLGRQNFSGVEYRGKVRWATGWFNPHDFDAIAKTMYKGKTPWIAIHPFTTSGTMERARIGPVYLAQKTGAQLIPAALQRCSDNQSARDVYYIGRPMQLEQVDLLGIDRGYAVRRKGGKLTRSELEAFKETANALQRQASDVARSIQTLFGTKTGPLTSPKASL